MITVDFLKSEIPDGIEPEYAVIAARYDGMWILSRHKERTTWELPGGHIEAGETPYEAACRELFEETGAALYDIKEVSPYCVTVDTERSYGVLFFAEVTLLGGIPKYSEITEASFFLNLPKNITYPAIQPQLWNYTQAWLNTQTSVDELWDVLDENRTKTGRLHRRGDMLPEGDYHLVVHVWYMNSEGKFLITKRCANKGFPNMWECTGGSAVAGDDSITAALRELFEETGITADRETGKIIYSYKRQDSFCDVWLFKGDFPVSDVVFLENETCDAMYASKEEILTMRDEGIFVNFRYLDDMMK